MNLRKADINDAERILEFYKIIIANSKSDKFNPKWNDKYPNLEFIKSTIIKEELFTLNNDENIIASVIVNDSFNEEYENLNWIVNAKYGEFAVIHTFAVHPEYSGKGIGKNIFNQIKENALKNNLKSIRIDVIDGNVGAEKVFRKLGFKYIDTVELQHNAVGLEKFHLYEYPLKKIDRSFKLL